MIALLMMLAVAELPELPVVQTASTSTVVCEGLCDKYRREAYEQSRLAKDLADENGKLYIAKAVYQHMLGKCLAAPQPECPAILPWAAGGFGAGVVAGVAASASICAASSH